MTDRASQDATDRSTLWLGVSLGVLSAVSYTVANIALRKVARQDFEWSVWVSCTKALPAAVSAWILVAFRASRGLPALPPRRLVMPLILVGLFMQCAGNVAFQYSLGMGGLALTVPVLFASLILCGSIAGRVFLGEAITPRSTIAMGMLIASIATLSIGAGEATEAVAHDSSVGEVTVAILTASLAGFAYGLTGVVIRSMVTGPMSVSATLVLMSTSGFVGLGLMSFYSMGLAGIQQTSGYEWSWMLAAGVMNAVAFFAVGGALQHIPVTQLNLLNASQAAMCAIAGVFWFDEPVTRWMVCGTSLTLAGLLLMDRGRKLRE
ncbi:MAG: DMT family transporter [Planctomycetota bacterium]|nr:DMT family transporter [Planctomycetota bacterium]